MDVDTAGRIGDALSAMLSAGVHTWGTNVTVLSKGAHPDLSVCTRWSASIRTRAEGESRPTPPPGLRAWPPSARTRRGSTS